MDTPRITFDTSCVMSLLYLPKDSTPKEELEALEQLQLWQMNDQIKIFVSEKSRTEAKFNLEKAHKSNPLDIARLEKWNNAIIALDAYES